MPDCSVSFPPELLHVVFDNLHPSDFDWATSWPKAQDVRQPLSACTLVSRSWYPIAREHLFRNVVYSFHRPDPEDDLAPANQEMSRWVATKPLCILKNDNSVNYLPRTTFMMFLNFLQQFPTIRSFIRKLRLACYPVPRRTIDNSMPYVPLTYQVEDADEMDPALLSYLVSILPRLVHLQTWNIFAGQSRSPDSLIEPISVGHLCLTYGHYNVSFTRVCKFLSYFAKIDHLEWSHMSSQGQTLKANYPSAIPLEIGSLTLLEIPEYLLADVLSDLILRSPSAHSLRRLSLCNVSLEAAGTLKRPIEQHAPFLEYLQITVIRSPDERTWEACALDLSEMKRLRELVIGVDVVFNSRSSQAWMIPHNLKFFRTTVLSPETNPELRKISFFFGRWDGDPRATESDWWETPGLAVAIADFEDHFINLVRAFKLEGIIFECHDNLRDILSEPPNVACLLALRRMVPNVFHRFA